MVARPSSQLWVLVALELALKDLDFPLILVKELIWFNLLLLGEHWLLVGILDGLRPTFRLFQVPPSLTAVVTELSGVQAIGLEHHRELVGSH